MATETISAGPEASEEVEQSLRWATESLESKDDAAAAMGAAAIAMLAPQAGIQCEMLNTALDRLVTLLNTSKDSLQKNACPALTSIIELDSQYWKAAIQKDAMRAAVNLLRSARDAIPLRLNATVLVGALIAGGRSGAEQFYRYSGLSVLQSTLDKEQDPFLLEAAVDVVCKLACEPYSRPDLVQGGMLQTLAGLLDIPDRPETLVRALMGIVMLMDGSKDLLRQLARCKGAVKCLAAIMRSSTDPDCKRIATNLFVGLASDAGSKKVVTQTLQKA